jgi:glycine cleavage system aminomethyltransferase T
LHDFPGVFILHRHFLHQFSQGTGPDRGGCIFFKAIIKERSGGQKRKEKAGLGLRKSSPYDAHGCSANHPSDGAGGVSGFCGSTHKLSTYRGVLTPEGLDARETEIAALATGAAVHDLGWQRRVAVRGEDRFRWLSGMVTNMVTDLAPNSARGTWF